MDWFIPLSIIPGAGLIILSTSSIMLTLNEEITGLVNKDGNCTNIIRDKLLQLKRLSISIVFQYIGVFFLLVSGIIGKLLSEIKILSEWLLLFGTISICISIVFLIVYSTKAVSIRQKHLTP
ncbi:MAG: hypothetical protein HQ521_13585 [Bacteroidetes bacterium]|nr:hypothetical protein [Bacteroidota bacterium]